MEIQRLTRRQLLRVMGGTALAAGAGMSLLDSASAARAWCRVDPLFLIDGYLFDIAISSDVAMMTSSTGPIAVTLHIPQGSNAQLVVEDLGFGYGYTYQVVADRKQLSKTSFSVGVDVVAPAKDSTLPVAITLTSLDKTATIASTETVTGAANRMVSWYGKVAKVVQLDAAKIITG